jgi:hypothetical protein
VPRFLACLIMTPVLTVYSNLLGIWGGWLITVQWFGVSSYDYWHYSATFVNWWEPTSGLIKSVFFGGSIGLIACYKGFFAGAGASGVGLVLSNVDIIIEVGGQLKIAEKLPSSPSALWFGCKGSQAPEFCPLVRADDDLHVESVLLEQANRIALMGEAVKPLNIDERQARIAAALLDLSVYRGLRDTGLSSSQAARQVTEIILPWLLSKQAGQDKENPAPNQS